MQQFVVVHRSVDPVMYTCCGICNTYEDAIGVAYSMLQEHVDNIIKYNKGYNFNYQNKIHKNDKDDYTFYKISELINFEGGDPGFIIEQETEHGSGEFKVTEEFVILIHNNC